MAPAHIFGGNILGGVRTVGLGDCFGSESDWCRVRSVDRLNNSRMDSLARKPISTRNDL